MKKFSLDAQELLSQSELFEIKAGENMNSEAVESLDSECTKCDLFCVNKVMFIGD